MGTWERKGEERGEIGQTLPAQAILQKQFCKELGPGLEETVVWVLQKGLDQVCV